MRPCPHPDGPPQPESCRICFLYANEPVYQKLYDAMVIPSAERSLECFFLGDVIDNRGCNCPSRWKRVCDIFGACTLGDAEAGVQVCSLCKRYSAEPV